MDVPHGGLDRGGLARYFSLGFVPALRTVFGNVRELRAGERIEGAIERRLMADVPLGAFLSGGIDSSVVGTMA